MDHRTKLLILRNSTGHRVWIDMQSQRTPVEFGVMSRADLAALAAKVRSKGGHVFKIEEAIR